MPGGDWLWLRPDGLTTAALGPNSLLPGFIGILDANGSASASMQLLPAAPLPATLVGTNLHLAPLAFRGADLRAGAPVILEFRP